MPAAILRPVTNGGQCPGTTRTPPLQRSARWWWRCCIAACSVGPLVAATAQPVAESKPPGVAVPDVEPAAGDAAAEPEPEFEWDLDWRGWDGLRFRLEQPTAIENTGLPVIRLDRVRLSGVLGGKIEVDAAAFSTNGNLSGFDDGVELRRARVKLRGDAILGVPFQYRIDLGYVPNQFSINTFYVAIPDLGRLGTLQVGQFQPAIGLDLLTSSWDITFMEPAAPLQALAPRSSPGAQVGRPWTEGDGTWAVGAYGSGSGNGEYGSAVKNLETIVGRVTWRPLDANDESDTPQLLHVGLSGNLQRSGNGQLRLRSRPESYIAPYVIDTGVVNASTVSTVGAELAWVDGPFSAQGELLGVFASSPEAGSLRFGGLYAAAQWILTGESRPFDRTSGTFARLRPLRDFAFGADGGWGAVELGLRASFTDLDSGAVRGGRLAMLMGGLNWFLTPHLTWRLDLGAGRVRGGASDGNLLILQSRVGVDF